MLKDVESVTLFKWEAKTYPFNYSLKLKRKKKKNSSWLTMKMFSTVPSVKIIHLSLIGTDLQDTCIFVVL